MATIDGKLWESDLAVPLRIFSISNLLIHIGTLPLRTIFSEANAFWENYPLILKPYSTQHSLLIGESVLCFYTRSSYIRLLRLHVGPKASAMCFNI